MRIAIVGDYNSTFHSHPATNMAIGVAAHAAGLEAEPVWVATDEISPADPNHTLAQFDGIWLGPGSPYRSSEGALAAVRFARERQWPFVGT